MAAADQKNQNPLISTITEDEQFFSPEGLVNATTAVDWDALLNCGNSSNSNTAQLSKWERDSLYVKFDPLVSSRNPSDRVSGIFKAPKPPGPSKQFLSQQNGYSPRTSGNLNFANLSSMSLDESYRTAYQDLSMSMPLVEEDCVSPSSPNENGNAENNPFGIPETPMEETGVPMENSAPVPITKVEEEAFDADAKLAEIEEQKIDEGNDDGLPASVPENSNVTDEQNGAPNLHTTFESKTKSEIEEEDVFMDHDRRDESLADLCMPPNVEEYCASPVSPDPDGIDNSENVQLVFSLEEEFNVEKESVPDKPAMNSEDAQLIETDESTMDENKGNLLEKSNLMGELEEAFSHLTLDFGTKTNQNRVTPAKKETNSSVLVEVDEVKNVDVTVPLEKDEMVIELNQSRSPTDLSIPHTEEVNVSTSRPNKNENRSSETNLVVAEAIHNETTGFENKSASIAEVEETQEAANKTAEVDGDVSELADVNDDQAGPYSERSKLIVGLKETVSSLTQELEAKVKRNREILAKEEMDLNDSVEEYLKAMKNYEQVQLEKDEMIRDRDEAQADLRNMEKGFADMLMMYEGIKNCQNDVEHNCETLIKREALLMTLLERREERNEACQQHFEDVLARIEQDFEGKLREREAENLKLKAKLRICDIKIGNTESEIHQIDRENLKLKSLCDDLLKK